ncbi:MAG TPA: MFS transporter [Actinomycetota bacterium]|nr:MFS transporter [Actinomycetota bacterium]
MNAPEPPVASDIASRRELVPSERESQAGERVAEPVAVTTSTEASSEPWTARLRSFLADLDPRRVAGGAPMLPLAVLALSALIQYWDDYALGILLPEMSTEFGFDLGFLITLQGVLRFVSLTLAPVMGYLADRVRRVWMLRAGALLSNASSVVTGLAPGVPLIVAGRIGTGVGASVMEPAMFPLMTDMYPSGTRARVFAFWGISGQIGIVAGPIIAGNLAVMFGWRVAIVSLGVLATLVSLGTFLLKEPKRGAQEAKESGADQSAVPEPPPVGWSEAWRAARSIRTVRRLWYATPFLEAGGTAFLFIMSLYYAEVFGLDPRARGYIVAISGVVGMVAIALSGPIGDRMIAHRPGRVMTVMSAGLVLQCVVIAVLAVSPHPAVSVAVSLPLTFVSALFVPALYALISLTVPARIRGLGLQTIAPWRLGGIVILLVIGGLGTDLRTSLLALIPLFLIGAVVLGTASHGVDTDIRSARAATLAGAEAALSGGALLVCRDLDVHHGGAQVLFGMDFDVREGEVVAVLGTNGAGKSTLLRAISGIHPVSAGAIFFDGLDVTHLPPHVGASRGIVMMPGGRAVFPGLTVADNLRTAAWLHRTDDRFVADATERVLDFFPRLRERLGESAGSLSGGEQQMLALGQAFCMKPRLLLIDELSLGLAPAIIAQLLEILRAIHAGGTTIVIVEQSVAVARQIADRAVFMEKGRARFDGPTSDLLHRSDILRSVFLGAAVTAAPSRSGRSGAGRSGVASSRGVRTSPDPEPPDAESRSFAAPDHVLSAEDLRVSFGGVAALGGVSIGVAREEIVGIIGPNGAGKTTLFDVLTGFVLPDSGRVVLDSHDVTALPPDARARLGLGRSFQNPRLFPTLTVRENLAMSLQRHTPGPNPVAAAAWLRTSRRSERTTARRVEELLGAFGLRPFADLFASELSIGTRRTVELACQAGAEPSVLLLDEPSSGLAQAETAELGPVLRRLVRETGCGLVVVEHDVPLVSSVADRLVAMELGQVVAQGEPDDVLSHPEVVRSYLAASGAGPGT